MAINDLYQLTLRQRFALNPRPMYNVWTFRGMDAGATAEALFDAFVADDSWLELINKMQADAISNLDITVINLFSLTDFYTYPVAGTGYKSADSLPKFASFSYTFRLDTRGINPGHKGISGVAENVQTDGAITDAGTLAEIEAFRVAQSAVLNDGAAPDFEHVVIKRIRHEPDEDHENVWYTLPTTSGEANYGKVVAALYNPFVSHNISRR